MLFQDTQDRDVTLIGLSLSFCVKDIMSGHIDPRQVHSVLTSCVPSEGGLPYISSYDFPENYYKSYWSKYTPHEVQDVTRGIVFMSRTQHIINIAEGYWLVKIGFEPMVQVQEIQSLSDHIAEGYSIHSFNGPTG